ncbi:hypothetical protein ENSA5_06660 [Enhygromyxa salina]|uniref:Uncharacterized protein n=1 Tax=Enhygromyxa salina TaxID=215803 RepID=A0A2S9YHM2_9BACT|nr:hypothetical protein [Enhygromyxa salina]PRQ04542.1 hypothetical protein ENSA5_06660 [Enhygromyxa salina]
MAALSADGADAEHDDTWALGQIADELEAQGLEVDQLRDLTEELAIIERPPGLFRRVTKRARAVAVEQWSHFVGELEESREAMALIRARGERELSDEERAKVREQIMDLVRLFPAGLIAAVNTALPVPGTSVFTPWLLVKLGLMPSRWRESHLLDQLRKQKDLLLRTGHAAQAERIGEILLHLETEAEQRELIQRETRLLTHWDENRNGLWDEAELEAYGREVEAVRELVVTHAARKQWFFEHEGEVYGAARLSELDDLEEAAKSLLVCFDGKTGWVALEHVLSPP